MLGIWGTCNFILRGWSKWEDERLQPVICWFKSSTPLQSMPSSLNGKTTDSDSAFSGSNPERATKLKGEKICGILFG